MCFTIWVVVATDGTKCPLFAIFNGKPDSYIEKQLPIILPNSVHGYTQEQEWCDERAMNKRYGAVR